jgi:hypothetical protein
MQIFKSRRCEYLNEITERERERERERAGAREGGRARASDSVREIFIYIYTSEN